MLESETYWASNSDRARGCRFWILILAMLGSILCESCTMLKNVSLGKFRFAVELMHSISVFCCTTGTKTDVLDCCDAEVLKRAVCI